MALATDDLVQKIKEMQRYDKEAKDQWIAYTDAHGQGRRDPTKHPAEFLQGFVEQYSSGMRQTLHEDAGQVCDLIQMMQAKSENFKNMWDQYANQFGNGNTNAATHGPAFHVKFLDYIAEKANSVTPNVVGMAAPGFEGPPGKRPRTESLGAAADPVKEKLVNQIKQFQRQGDDKRDLWRSFCESNLASVLDPNRHEASVLQSFVNSYNVPEAEIPPSAGGFMMGSSPPVLDEETEALVNKVKAFQRIGPEQKEAWYGFCGNKRDPARHDAAKLQEFCSLHGIS